MTVISRADAICEVLVNDGIDNIVDRINKLPSAEAEPKENHTQATGAKHVIKSLGTDSISHNGIDCTEFIYWLMEEVMDDEMWELNAVGNGEIICRKLVKLGVLEVTEEPSYYIRPSAEADWIPVSERLPEDSGDYLVCPNDDVIEDYSDCRDVMIMPYDADCEAFGWWTERYDPISLGFVDSDFDEFEVLAWMPLPKPYREDGEE